MVCCFAYRKNPVKKGEEENKLLQAKVETLMAVIRK